MHRDVARSEGSGWAAEPGLAATQETRRRRDPLECTMSQWNKRTRLQPVQFEWEEEPQPRAVRLVSTSAQVSDPVRVTVSGVPA